MKLPIIPDTTLKGAAGEALVKLMFLGKAVVTSVQEIDYGIDIEAILLEGNSPSGRTFVVQVKYTSSKPRIKQETKNSWKQRVEPVFVLWVKSTSSKEKPSYEEAINAIKYFRSFPSRHSIKEAKKYVEYEKERFLNEIKHYWDEYDKKQNNITNDKNPIQKNVYLKKNIRKIGKDIKVPVVELLENIEETISQNKALDDYQKIRLFLFSSSQLYRHRIPSEIIGNHEIQLLYTFKDKVKSSLSSSEIILLARTLISDKFNHKVGWFWIKFNNKFDDLIFIIEYLIINDQSEDVIIGALQLLNYFWNDKYLNILNKQRQMINENIRVKELEIVENNPSLKSLEYCQKFLTDTADRIQNKAQDVYTALYTKLKPHDATGLVLSNKGFNKYKISSNFYHEVTEAELRSLMNINDDYLKVDVIQELVNRNVLLEAELFELIKDKNWNIKYLAIKRLLDNGKQIDVEIIRELLRPTANGFGGLLSRRVYGFEENDLYKWIYIKNNIAVLKDKLYWGFGGEVIYETLNIKDTSLLPSVRDDLINGFVIRRNNLLVSEATKKGVPEATIKSFWEPYNATITSIFIEAGLNVLINFGRIDDRKIALRFINDSNYSVKSNAKKLLLKYAQTDDIQTLLDIAKKEKDNDFLQKSIIISNNKVDFLTTLIQSQNDDFIQYSLVYSIKYRIKLNNEIVIQLLTNDNDSIRKFAVLYLYKNNKRLVLITILKKYYSKQIYYYNVVSILDTLLYSPLFLKTKILGKLENDVLSQVK